MAKPPLSLSSIAERELNSRQDASFSEAVGEH